jgi:hypothetical protein
VEGALRAAGERYEAAVSARGNFAELARTLPKQFSHGDAQLEQALRALQGGHQIIWSESLSQGELAQICALFAPGTSVAEQTKWMGLYQQSRRGMLEELAAQVVEDEDEHVAAAYCFSTLSFAVKLLVSDACAATVIGSRQSDDSEGNTRMRGSSIDIIKRHSTATIEVSHPGEHFPGTSSRVILITSADMMNVIMAGYTVVDTIADINVSGAEAGAEATFEVQVSIPDGAVDFIMRDRGEALRNIISRTHCDIAILDETRSQKRYTLRERIVALGGTTDDIMHAIGQILNKMAGTRAPRTDGKMYRNMSTQYGR